MKRLRLRAVFAAVAFFGWIGYLGWVALARVGEPVVSRAQMAQADALVVAEVRIIEGMPDPVVKVVEALQPTTIEAGATPQLLNLPDAKLSNATPLTQEGSYLIPLRNAGSGWEVAAGANGMAIVYPWSETVRRQIAVREPEALAPDGKDRR